MTSVGVRLPNIHQLAAMTLLGPAFLAQEPRNRSNCEFDPVYRSRCARQVRSGTARLRGTASKRESLRLLRRGEMNDFNVQFATVV